MALSMHSDADTQSDGVSDGGSKRSPIDVVLEFWFGPGADDESVLAERKQVWFSSRPQTDREIRERFAGLVRGAAAGDLDDWSATPRGRLAMIVLLDQFPRNLYRGTGDAFRHDGLALRLCIDGIDAGVDRQLSLTRRVFFCMPLQHSESLEIQQRSVAVFEALADEACPEAVARALADFADYARRHRDIVARFGRFPHRNAALGRSSTAEEIEFLDGGGPSFGQ